MLLRGAATAKDGTSLLERPANAYFRGSVAGDPASRAVVTVDRTGRLRGMVRDGAGTFVLAPEPSTARRAGRLVATDLASLAADAEGFRCERTASPDDPAFLADLQELAATAAPQPLTTTPYQAEMAIETDFELYQNLGSAAAVADYAGELVAYASTLFDDEIHTTLVLGDVSIWSTAADPWVQPGAACGLFEMAAYWNANRQGVDRDLVHFLSGKTNNSGFAWFGVLCSGGGSFDISAYQCTGMPDQGQYFGDYAYSGGIDGSFDAASPELVGDLFTFSHETGHNFNSPHSHCYNGIGGSSEPVDECFSGEFQCYSGPTSLPCNTPGAGCGTLMSYCHLLSGGLDNISYTFGAAHQYGTLPQRIPERMRSHVETVAAGSSCLDVCDDDLVLDSGSDNGTAIYSVCGTITAGGSYSVGPNGDVTFNAGRVVLTEGFQVFQGASFRADG